MAGKTYLKTGTFSWERIKKIYLKTGGQTWQPIRKAYLKTGSFTWQKIFDTASNRPFIGNDIPKIRLNTFRTNSTYDPAGTANDPVNPVVEAPPVQQMGPPTTTPTTGWAGGTSIGNHLWGYDGTWTSGNGSAMTFTYQWLYNYSGDKNDNTFDPAFSPAYDSTTSASNTSSTGRADMLTNTQTYLGRSLSGVPGGYFDRNFLTFRVGATNSAGGPVFAESDQVYIVKQRPTGAITMIAADEASVNSTMSASFNISNNWYKTVEKNESYVEWFAVDNIGDALTTTNRVQFEYLNTFSYPEDQTTATSLSATTYHVPTLMNKYYYVKLTLNNSNTLPAKYAGNIINVVGFTPNAAQVYTANKNAKTAPSNGPFNLTNPTKGIRYYDSVSNSYKRQVTVNVGQSQYADRYEVQIEGQNIRLASGSYDTSISAYSWSVIRSLDAAPYIYESARTAGTLTETVQVPDYRGYRITARSRNGTTLNGAAYSNNGTSTSYVYVEAPNVAPSTPTISNLQTATDALGAYVTFNTTTPSLGSNDDQYQEFSINNGSTWQTITSGFTVGTGYIVPNGASNPNSKIYLTPGSTINLRVRLTNWDNVTSSQSNVLSITVAAVPGAPTNVITKSFISKEGTIFFTSSTNTQSVRGYLEYEAGLQFDSISGLVNVNSNTAAKIQLSGAASSTASYFTYLIPYSQQNGLGNSGSTSTYTSRVLNGQDVMNVTVGLTQFIAPRTIQCYWTLDAGSPTHYYVNLIKYSTGQIISTKEVQEAGSSFRNVTFTSTDGIEYSTVYYIQVIPIYRYAAGVEYNPGSGPVSANKTSGPNLVTPTSGIVTWNDSTSTATLNFSGTGIGPYYQMYWNSTSFAPLYQTTYYDAARNTSGTSISDTITGPSADTTYYFYVRSSNQNIATTTTSGNATENTYSDWSSASTATFRKVTYDYNNGTGTPASVNVISGNSITLPSPTRTGFSFSGWYTALTGGTLVGAAGASYTVTSTLTLYARWASNVRASGSMRRVTMPAAFASSSQTVWVGTNGYVSVTVDPTTTPGTTWPTAGGTVVGPFVMDCIQSSLSTKADATNFYVRWQGYRFGATSETLDYLMKFTWGSPTVDVYFITNNSTIEPSLDAVRNGNTSYQTWANSTAISGMTIPTGMTSNTTNNGVDDNRTAITATKTSTIVPPTANSVSKVNSTTLRVNFTAVTGSGPYYQIYWLGSNSTPPNTQTSYDAATNSSSSFCDESFFSISAGTTYYFWVRSSTENISTTTAAGTATSGTFSNWSSVVTYTEPAQDLSSAPSQPAAPSNNWTSGTNYPFSWQAPSSTGTNTNGTTATITGYTLEIYKADNSSGGGTYASPWAIIPLGNVTSTTYTSDDSSKYYAAAVKATNSANKTSTISARSLYK